MHPEPDSRTTHPYILGHSRRELERLKTQARLIDPITRRFLAAAGLQSGMRLLDVGSGAGDVAFLAADMVGTGGEVVGVDRSGAAIAEARARAAERSLPQVSFHEGDPAEMTFDRPFDAVVGRYVLQFQRKPAAMLRRLASQVRPGGVLMFHELDWAGLTSFPAVPTFDQCCRWGMEMLRRHGTENRMGIKLHATFVAAGLPQPSMRFEAPVGGGANATDILWNLVDFLGTVLPEMERLGVAKAAEVGLDTLMERIVEEAKIGESAFVGFSQFGAWSRV
ncbi:MAG: class I SAM-dependent methyltransferase [Candidatus Eisenbacteria bacterium]